MATFSFDNRLNRAAAYDREFFRHLFAQLEASGLSRTTVLLPTNLFDAEFRSPDPEAFLGLTVRVPAVLIRASSQDKSETLRFIVADKNKKSVFPDEQFPYVDGGEARVHVVSPDPVRAFALAGYFGRYAWENGKQPDFASHPVWVFTFGLSLLLEVATFSTEHRLLLQSVWRTPLVADVIFMVFALWILVPALTRPSGVVMHARRSSFGFLGDFLRGRFKDNPLLIMLYAIVGTLIGGILLHFITKHFR